MPMVGGVTAAPVDTELGSLCEVTKLSHPEKWGFVLDVSVMAEMYGPCGTEAAYYNYTKP